MFEKGGVMGVLSPALFRTTKLLPKTALPARTRPSSIGDVHLPAS